MNPTSSAGAGERILLTGATGFLGQQILRVLLHSRPAARLVVLARPTAEKTAAERVRQLVGRLCAPESRAEAMSRIDVLAADTGLPRCGLSESEWMAAAEATTRIIHAAAAVRFDAPLEETRRANVGGVRNLLDLARESHRRGSLRAFTHVSTAFVAGCRAGLVREDELDAGQSFRNDYERTKFEAERLVQDRLEDLPAAIVRPSVVVGDSRTGVTTSFHMMYWPLRAYAKHGWRIVPGTAATVVDMVPVDFVADATVHLSFDRRALGRTFHLCAGPERSATIGEIAAAASRFFHVPPPRFVRPGLFLALLRPLLSAVLWGPRRRILRNGAFYRPYLDMRLEFDTAQADALLSPAGIRPAPVLDYLERLFAFCLETDWGHHAPQTPSPSQS